MHVEIRTLSGVFEGILIHTLYLRVFHAGNVAQSPDAEFADNMRRVDQSTQQAVHEYFNNIYFITAFLIN